MKILYVTTIGITMGFFTSFIKTLLDKGDIVEIATNEKGGKVPSCYREWNCQVYQIDTARSPFNIGNLKAIQQIGMLVKENKYDIVHCHTPVAAMCTRVACRNYRKNGTKVFYTAHGFHFYKGAPFRNWFMYYPVEWICAHWTDTLITINKEDYALARKKMKAKDVVYVPGVGIDLSKFEKVFVDKRRKRNELGIPENAIFLFSVGELNENKNHETVIHAIAMIKDVYYVIAGEGSLHEHLQEVIDKLNLSERVKLLGYRNDIDELCKIADVYVMPSYREGLSVALMEAMACGLPCVVSNIRGNIDLIDKNGGEIFNPHSIKDCQQAIKNVLSRDKNQISKYNIKKIKNYSLETINEQMQEIVRKSMLSH